MSTNFIGNSGSIYIANALLQTFFLDLSLGLLSCVHNTVELIMEYTNHHNELIVNFFSLHLDSPLIPS